MRRRNSLIALYASQYLIVGLFDNICLLGAVGGQGIDGRDKYRTLRLWPDFNGILKTRFRVSILVWNVKKQRVENVSVSRSIYLENRRSASTKGRSAVSVTSIYDVSRTTAKDIKTNTHRMEIYIAKPQRYK